MTPDTNGWTASELFVREELKRLSAKMDSMDEKITNLRVDVAQKGAVAGAISGALIALGGHFLKGKA